MKKKQCKWIILAVVMALLLTALPLHAHADGGDIAITSRHVAIVFDDSGSMYTPIKRKVNKSWARANYMMQAFCGLLGADDSLFITYMSDIEGSSEVGNRLEGDREESIATIRDWQGDGDTPYEAVETAYQSLKDIEANSRDEYWLVVMSDGSFNNLSKDLNTVLEGYIKEMAEMGRTLKVVFFSIGEKAKPPQPNEDVGLLVYQTDIQGIIPTLSDMADTISARQAVNPKKIKQVNRRTLSFETYIPMYALALFSQGEENPLTSVQLEDGSQLAVGDTYHITAPESFKRANRKWATTDDSLKGQIVHIAHDDVLPAGRYTLEFENDVDLSNLRILYQSAIAIELRYLYRGQLEPSPRDGQIVDIEAILVDASTGEAFNPNALEGDITCRMKEVVDGKVVSYEDGFMLKGIKLQDERTGIVVEAVMPGYGTLSNRLNFIEREIPVVTPAPTADPNAEPFPPIVTIMVQGNGRRLDLKTLEDAAPFRVNPLYNKKRAPIESLRAGTLTISCGRNISFETVLDEATATYLVYPRYQGGMLATSTGAITCNVTYTSEYESETATMISFMVNDMTWVQRNLSNLIFPMVALVLALACCGILFFRKRLPKDGYIEYAQFAKNKRDEWVTVLPPAQAFFSRLSGSWRLIPFAPERINVSGITFLPGKDDQSLVIPRGAITDGMGTERKGDIDKKSLKGGYVLRSGVTFYMMKHNHKITFIYHAPKHSLLQSKKGNKK